MDNRLLSTESPKMKSEWLSLNVIIVGGENAVNQKVHWTGPPQIENQQAQTT